VPRAKGGFTTRRRHKKVLKRAKGFYGGRSRQYKTASEAVIRAMAYATHGRKLRKRDFRKLWVMRINAAARACGITYSRFICGIHAAGIELDRKVLADIAINDSEAFEVLAEKAKASLAALAA